MITQKEANERAKFFYKQLFGMNLVYPVVLLSNKEMEEYIAEFSAQHQVFMKRVGDINGVFFHTDDCGIGDPNEATIYVNKNRCKDVNLFNGTLIHELIHCGLWWQGLEYDDGQPDFEKRLREAGLYSNCEFDYSKDADKDHFYHKKEGSNVVMAMYEKQYQDWKKKDILGTI